MSSEYDLVIIGGGSGGLVAASIASQLKAKVALVEKERLGGDCLWSGCVPSKSLIHAAKIAYEVKHSSRFGIYTNTPEINFAEVIDHVHKVITMIQPHDSPERFEGLGVEVIFGSGEFINKNTLLVNGRKLTARAFIIATGSRPRLPNISGLQEGEYLTNEQVFSLTEIPRSLAIIGAGPIGCELGQAFHRLGSKVTIISSRNQILPKEDPEAASVLEEQFVSEGIEIVKNTRIEKIAVINGKKQLDLGEEKIIVDHIFLATGRTPNVESLNLEIAGVNYDQEGIKVNQKMQTTNTKIYACGDVIGGYQFTHVAAFEAYYATMNALFLPIFKADYRVIPWTTFTDPELARVGLTEQQAKLRYGEDVYILKQPFSGVDRAQTQGITLGFGKIICRGNGAILGAHLVGSAAGELIHEIVLAMANNLKVSQLSSIHVYPTLSEVNSKAALLLTKQKYAQNQWQKNLLTKFFDFRRLIG